MHRGCCVRTPTPPLSRWSTPRPGPACVCVCLLFLAWSGRPSSGARFGAPHLSFGRFVLLLSSAPYGLGLPVLRVFFFWLLSPLFSLSPRAPPLSPAFCTSRPWVPWALALFVCSCPPLPPPFFLLLFVLSSCVSCPLAPCAPALAGRALAARRHAAAAAKTAGRPARDPGRRGRRAGRAACQPRERGAGGRRRQGKCPGARAGSGSGHARQ